MSDPTYDKERIDAKPEWRLAFLLSELLNDDAPIGWAKYVPVAQEILKQYERKPIPSAGIKHQDEGK